jgi:uncharacterized spore protein YtfJ
MSEKTTNVEDSIKIALDAADMATSAASELDRIKLDNSSVRDEMKRVYRKVSIVFASALVGTAVSLLGAAVIYYKTLSGMETANNTSLEALVIFADNIDKLTAAVSSVSDMTGKLGEISSVAEATNQAVSGLGEKVSSSESGLNAQLASIQEQLVNSVSQFSRSVVDEMNVGLEAHGKTGEQMLSDINRTSAQILALMGGGNAAGADEAPAAVAGLKQAQVEEIIASLQKILLTQAEITTKINGMSAQKKPSNSSANKTKPKQDSTPTSPTDDMIKFP